MDKTINAYTCGKEGHIMITRDVDKGTTPMTVTCRHCVAEDKYGVIARSQFYNVDQDLEPTHEWYKPMHPERIKDYPTREHCARGGLLLREVGKGDYTVDLPPVPATIERPVVPKGMGRPNDFARAIFRTLTNVNKSYRK